MKIDIVTLFPKMFKGPFEESIVKRAREKGLVQVGIHDIRKWAKDKHKTVDDRPYGGGVGMVLMIEPIYRALRDLKKENKKAKVILLDAGGKKFTQAKANQLSQEKHLVFIAGHYEGMDHRVHEHLINEEISIGDYVLTGGELPTMVVVDSVVRLVPGVLEKPEATQLESFSNLTPDTRHPIPVLEYPQYTRPEEFQRWKVPEILLSGNHKKIQEWKEQKALERTKKNRPDLLEKSSSVGN